MLLWLKSESSKISYQAQHNMALPEMQRTPVYCLALVSAAPSPDWDTSGTTASSSWKTKNSSWHLTLATASRNAPFCPIAVRWGLRLEGSEGSGCCTAQSPRGQQCLTPTPFQWITTKPVHTENPDVWPAMVVRPEEARERCAVATFQGACQNLHRNYPQTSPHQLEISPELTCWNYHLV